MSKSRRLRTASILYKSVFAVLLLTGILSRAGILNGRLQLHTLYSFTTISNFCALVSTVFTLVTAFSPFAVNRPTPAKLRYIVVILMLITGIVYHFILLPDKYADNPGYQVLTYGNIVAHYIAPAGLLADWLLFDKKGLVTKWEPIICVSAPLTYFIVASVYGYYGSAIPESQSAYVYFFMDWGRLGFAGVLKWFLIIFCIILSLAYAVYVLDVLLGSFDSKEVVS